MAYNSDGGFWHGTDALTPAVATRDAFISYIEALFADEDGEYYPVVGHAVQVTSNREIAAAAYQAGTSSIAVLIGKGSQITWGKKVGAVQYDGARHECSLDIDLAAAKEVSDDGPPEDETAADNKLAGLFETAVRRSLTELGNRGLFNIEVMRDEERQRSGEGRNPLKVTYFTRALYDYS